MSAPIEQLEDDVLGAFDQRHQRQLDAIGTITLDGIVKLLSMRFMCLEEGACLKAIVAGAQRINDETPSELSSTYGAQSRPESSELIYKIYNDASSQANTATLGSLPASATSLI